MAAHSPISPLCGHECRLCRRVKSSCMLQHHSIAVGHAWWNPNALHKTRSNKALGMKVYNPNFCCCHTWVILDEIYKFGFGTGARLTPFSFISWPPQLWRRFLRVFFGHAQETGAGDDRGVRGAQEAAGGAEQVGNLRDFFLGGFLKWGYPKVGGL